VHDQFTSDFTIVYFLLIVYCSKYQVEFHLTLFPIYSLQHTLQL